MTNEPNRPRIRPVEPEEYVDLLVSRRRLVRVRPRRARPSAGSGLAASDGLRDVTTGEIFVPCREPRSVEASRARG